MSVEHRGERGPAQLAERVAQVHPALAVVAAAPEAVADAQRRLDRLRADAVRLGALAQLGDALVVGAQVPVGEALGVVGVDQQAVDPVGQLAGDGALLQRREPARQRDRHRVVGGGHGDVRERAVAQLAVAVARPRSGARPWSCRRPPGTRRRRRPPARRRPRRAAAGGGPAPSRARARARAPPAAAYRRAAAAPSPRCRRAPARPASRSARARRGARAARRSPGPRAPSRAAPASPAGAARSSARPRPGATRR